LALLGGGPREVYRIYSEEDYLACADLLEESELAPAQAAAPPPPEQHLAPDERPHRWISSAAALAAACMLLGVLVGSHLGRRGRDAPPPTERAGQHGTTSAGQKPRSARRPVASRMRPPIRHRARARGRARNRRASPVPAPARARAERALRSTTTTAPRRTATAALAQAASAAPRLPRQGAPTAAAAAEFGFER